MIPSAVNHAASDDAVPPPHNPSTVVMLSGRKFVLGCAAVAVAMLIAGRFTAVPVWLLAAEVLATILGLFLFGSFRYQIHKNALTYGMLLVIIATFCGLPTSAWHVEIADAGLGVLDAASICCRFAGSTS